MTDTAVLRRLPPLLAVLAGFYLVLSQVYLARLPLEAERSAVVAFISAGILLLLRAFVCRKQTPARWSHPLAVFVASVVLTNVLVDMAGRSDLRQTMVLLFTFVGMGFTLLSVRWLAFCLFASLVPWGLVACSAFAPVEWFPYGIGLLVAAVVSLVLGSVRLRRHARQPRPLSGEAQPGEERKETDRQEALAVAGTDDGLWHWDLPTDRVHLSTRWRSMLGYGDNDIGTRLDDWFSLIHPYYLQGFRRNLEAHLSGQTDQLASEYRIRHRDGTYRWVLCRGRAIRDKDGRPIEVAGCQTDITRLIELEKSVIHDALHDRLTGLPNRSYLMARLERVVELYRQNPSHRFALIFLDLDGFKTINDTLGHLVGDQLLTAVACRLRDCRRSEDLVARFAGDEFVLLLEKLRDNSEALQVAKRVQDVLAEPFQLNGQEVLAAASIGVVLSNTGFKDAEALLRNADSAMYYAKRRGKGGIRVFSRDMTGNPPGEGRLEGDLRGALERQEFVLHYQPLISLKTGRISGAEALLRWQRRSGKLLAPSEFIPQAEESGLIVDVGEWALRTACAQNQSWRAVGLPPVPVSVNLSARQLVQPTFPDTVHRILAETGLDPNQLELELTESVLMDTIDARPQSLESLTTKGVRIAIDDFGSGCSSLSWLTNHRFHTLKIARSFVANLEAARDTAALAKGIIRLAHELRLKVAAAGVESQQQLSFLSRHGCDKIQGFLASRPLPAEQFAELLRSKPNLLPLTVADELSPPQPFTTDLSPSLLALAESAEESLDKRYPTPPHRSGS